MTDKPLPAPLQVVYRKVADLIPYARNARTHSDAQLAQIAGSVREFGWTNPILLDGASGIIAGHGRVLAARKLKMAEVPCIELGHLSEPQRRALVVADNKIALNSGWNDEMLLMELGEIVSDGFDLNVIGFNESEMEALLSGAAPGGGLTDENEVPTRHDIPISVPGDTWILGRHRLTCGDSTDPLVVAACLDGVTPMLMVTDPPYGVDYDPEWRSKALKDGAKRAEGKVKNDTRADWSEAWALFPGEVAYVWHGERQSVGTGQELGECGFQLRNLIVWGKKRHVLSRGHYHSRHETCWYAVKKGGTGHWAGDRSQTTLWEIEAHENDTGHGTQKPVECMRRPILNNSSAGQAVYEPFSGSGTTIIAAETTGRSAHAIEIDPLYVDVAVRRWQKFTGLHATLASDGRAFDDVAAERVK